MRKLFCVFVFRALFTLLFTLVILLCPATQPAEAMTKSASGKAAKDTEYGAMPLLFIPNQGQFDSRVVYAVQGRDKSIFFSSRGLTCVLSEQIAASPSLYPLRLRQIESPEPRKQAPQRRWTIKLDFVDANPKVKPETLEQAGTLISYFKGRPEAWRTGLQASARIIYRDLWPGIDLVYSGTVNRLKYDFIIHPGADPARIKLACRGVDHLMLTPSGQLEMITPLGTLQDEKPTAWQEKDGRRQAIAATYALSGPSGVQVSSLALDGLIPVTDPHEQRQVYSFSVGEYDRSRTLVLDPEMLVYCGFLGGSGDEYGYGIAVDSNGHAYVTGSTLSSEASFPETVGPSLAYNGGSDAFVAKVRADGTGLIYCGYLGGSGYDYGSGIAVDSFGNAYIAGSTDSSQTTFPVTVGPDLAYNGGGDAFVAKVRADGTGLVYCGYIGGSSNDYGKGIAVNSYGAYIVGYTYSTQATFPTWEGPDVSHNGYADAFVAKVNATGTGLSYCGYIGGADADYGLSIAVENNGLAYITGQTFSTEATFPEAIGPDLTHNGGSDAFVAKIRADGLGLVYCGYLGGLENDYGHGIGVDSLGRAYITGDTASTEATFPVVIGPDLTHNGNYDAFVARVRADAMGLDYCGYIGGSSTDGGHDIAVDDSGQAYITGTADSTQENFPVAVGPDLAHNGGVDAFIAKIAMDGEGLTYCGYIGGSNDDEGFGIALDDNGNAYVAGLTTSTGETFPVTIGPDLTYNGGSDAFIAKIAMRSFSWETFLPAMLKGTKKTP